MPRTLDKAKYSYLASEIAVYCPEEEAVILGGREILDDCVAEPGLGEGADALTGGGRDARVVAQGQRYGREVDSSFQGDVSEGYTGHESPVYGIGLSETKVGFSPGGDFDQPDGFSVADKAPSARR